ncbi:MAG: cobalamin-binding protein [Aquabacterium sp.]|nr:MAG: cobalamin-binding protein [Aquabacterium sp.]
MRCRALVRLPAEDTRAARMRPALLGLCALVAAHVHAAGTTIHLTDDAGHDLVLQQPARRVVALAPHLTELAYAAGGGAFLVGVGRYSDHPEAARRLPVVSDAFALDLEAIARLKPDLVLVWRSGTPQRQRERLRALGVPVFESEITSVDGIAGTLQRLGSAWGNEAAARQAADALRQRWRQLQERYASRTPVRVFVQLWDQPLMTVNHQHLIDAAVRACGGRNPFTHLPMLTPTITWEDGVRADPQLVVAADVNLEAARRGWQRFASVQAVRNGQIAGMDADRLTRMGPRFVEGAQQLCEAIDAARRASSPR